jgi:ATP-dependent Lhr-like helicase
VRIGLSATVKPLDAMARFLVGQRGASSRGAIDDVAIIDAGHVRERDLAIEVPRFAAGPR